MDLSVIDIDLRRAVIMVLRLACSSNIEIDGDGPQVFDTLATRVSNAEARSCQSAPSMLRGAWCKKTTS